MQILLLDTNEKHHVFAKNMAFFIPVYFEYL